MNQETIQLIRDLAAQLGTTSEKLFAVMTSGVRVRGIAAVLIVALMIGGMWYGVRLLRRGFSNEIDNEPAEAMIAAAGMLLVLGCSVTGVIFAYDGALALMAPEYVALTEILRYVR